MEILLLGNFCINKKKILEISIYSNGKYLVTKQFTKTLR